MGRQNPKGKVIKHFTIEVVDADSCPELKYNPSNPYSFMSDEERIRDLVDIWGTLLGETYRERCKRIPKTNENCERED
jgi:hypothetical protein